MASTETQVRLKPDGITGAEAGINGDEQIRIALRTAVASGGTAQMRDITTAVRREVETRSPGATLSSQGEASLRYYVNTVAVRAGYLLPFDKRSPGWHITPDGRDFLDSPVDQPQEVFNANTQTVELQQTSSAAWDAFERYVLELLKSMFPKHTWYHQGCHKQSERGLDMIGTSLIENDDTIGVQVKLHREGNQPTDIEWLKFLAGCSLRRVSRAVFVTTGRLGSNQRREANEAGVIVIEGRSEVGRIAKQFGMDEFKLYELTEVQNGDARTPKEVKT